MALSINSFIHLDKSCVTTPIVLDGTLKVIADPDFSPLNPRGFAEQGESQIILNGKIVNQD